MEATVNSVGNPHDLPEGFQMTELGPLPKEWRVVRLGEVAYLIPKKKREVKVRDSETYRLITVKLYAKGVILRNITRGDKIGTKTLYAVQEGDLVFSKIDLRNGAWGFVPLELDGALVSGDFPILRVDETTIWQDYLAYYISQPQTWEPFRAISVGTTGRRRVRPDNIRALLIPLPPLSEQRAIAHVLRTVQRAKEATDGVIAALKELKKSLMRHLFTYGPVPVTERERVPLQETEIGPIPAHWRVVRLGEVVTCAFGGGTPSTSNPDFWDGKIPWITSAIIQDDDIELFTFQRTITEDGLKNSSTSVAPKGSLLVGTRVGVGKAAVATFNVAINQDLTALILSQHVDVYFVAYLLKSRWYQSWFENNKRGATIKGVPRKDLLKLPIPLPHLSEQREIVRILQAVDAKIAAEGARRAALEELFKTLLHQLMTGQIRLHGVIPTTVDSAESAATED